MLTYPRGEVVDLSVHDSPTIGWTVVGLDCIKGDRFSGIGGCIYCRW